MGGGYLVSELTYPRPFPKGREAPSHERSYVKSVGSESHRSRYQEGSPFPLGRAGDGSSKPKGAASFHLTLNAKSRHDKAYDVHLAKGDAPQCVATLDFRVPRPSSLILAGSEAPAG